MCEDLCVHTPGCHSVDMHRTSNRCFLNALPCADLIPEDPSTFGSLVPSADYDLIVKTVHGRARQLVERARSLTPAQVRQLIAAEDPGVSWSGLLRFKSASVAPGKYKLCFCDKAVAGSCGSAENYVYDVGTVHATGLSCLLENPIMTRGSCVPQLHGGLRCYTGEAPAVELPTDLSGIVSPVLAENSEVTKSLIVFCQFAPLEEVREFGFCHLYRDIPQPTPAPTPKPTKKR
jgi:hypothetical protein